MSSFERIFWFYQRLRRNGYPSRQRYMATFEVSESTFKRDLAYFRDRMGAPIDHAPEKNGYFLTHIAFELPSFWFNRTQLLLLIGLSNQLRKMKGLTAGSELSLFRDRLQGLLTMHDGSDIADCFSFEHVEWAICDCRHLDLLMEAILQRRCVSLTYHSAHNDTISNRSVEPYRLHNYMGTWYLIGFCLNRHEARLFQLARLIRLELLPDNFGAPRFDASAHVDNSFGIFKGADAFEVVLRFDPFIARFVRNEIWHDPQKVEDGADGSLTLTLPVANLTEIKMKVLKYGHHVEVIKPDALRRQVADEAEMIVKNYAGR
jgi:predicted DNA-binding transcriptional regulator YafY